MKREERQREFGFNNHGGKRKGAGRRPKGGKAGAAHDRRARFKACQPLMITMRLCEGLRSVRADKEHALVRVALAAGVREDFRAIHYSVQSNHLHLVVEARSQEALASGMIGLTVRIARALNKLWRRKGKVFGERYHVSVLDKPKKVHHALAYVLNNGRKHGAWSAHRPDEYSSGRWFEGWAWPPKEAESSPRPLPRPRTWLLSVGWKRHGLIDSLAVPNVERRSRSRAR